MIKYSNNGAEQKQSPHLKRAPFKYLKWKFSSLIGHSVIVTQLSQKLSLYSK